MPRASIKGNVIPFRRRKSPLTNPRALALLRDKEVIEVPSVAALAGLLGWERTRASRALRRWEDTRQITVEKDASGDIRICALPVDPVRLREFGPGENRDKPRRKKREYGRSRKRADARPRVRQKRDTEKREIERENAPENRVVPITSENKPVPGNAQNGTSESVRDTTVISPSLTADNTSTVEALFPVMEAPEAPVSDRSPEYAGTAVVRGADRSVSRRGGGGVTGGGGGGPGFDAVDTFRRATWAERILILIAAGLSGTAAFMSVTGMVVMYPVEPAVIMTFGALIEAAKFFGFGVLAAGWRWYGGFSRLVAAGLLLVAAVINASGVYGRLISDHVGPAADRTATYTTQDAGQGAKVEVAQARVQDLDRQISQIDDAIAAATKRGRTNGAMQLAERERRNRARLASERDRAQQELANLKAGRTGLAARHQEAEASSTPVRYAAALFEDVGLLTPGTDPEKLMRWISFLILLTGDPLALALIWTMNSRARRQGGA